MNNFNEDALAGLLDLERYPILDQAAPAAQTFIARCRAEFQAVGACHLPGLIRAAAAAAMCAEVRAILPEGFYSDVQHNIYFKPDDTTLPEDHPARHKERTAKITVPYDQIPRQSGIARLYAWRPLRQFVAAVLGREELHLNADPLAALNLFSYETGGEIGWHYDRADFVTTLLLQPCEAGGVYEYVPNLRTDTDENYGRLGRVLAGADEGVVRLPGEAGSLTLFSGHYSLHRVTPVIGATPRVIAVLSYEKEPGVMFNAYARKLFYGREEPLAAA
jgi:hypothetical protein